MSSLDALFGPKSEEAGHSAEQRVEQLLALNRAAIAITGELELDSLLQRIVDVARELVGCKYAALGVLGDDGYITRFPTSGISETDREKIGAPPRGHGLLGVMLRAGRTVRVPDLNKDPRRVGFPPNHPPMTSLLGVPIFVRGRLMGDLYLSDKEETDEFSEEDEWLVQLLATHAATALTNAQLHAENMAAFRDLQALQDAVQQIASHLDLEPMAAELLRYASQITGSRLAWLGLLDKEGKLVTTVAVHSEVPGDKAPIRDLKIDIGDPRLGNDPTGIALRTMAPQIIRDIETDPTLEPWKDLIEQYDVHSGVAVPVVYQGKALGVLNLYSQSIGSFKGQDLALLQVMAGHAAIAIQNSMNYRQVTRERAGSQALLRVNQAINRSVHLDEVLTLIVQSAVELLGAAGAAVYLLEEGPVADDGSKDTGSQAPAASQGKQKGYWEFIALRFSMGLHEGPRGQHIHLPIKRSMAGRAVKAGKTQVVADTADWPKITFPRLDKGRPLRS
ncbi:MAG: GAF domain-containing protein, partial [Chloroflexia bacterium]